MSETILNNSIELVATVFTLEFSSFISMFYLLLKALWITSEKRKNVIWERRPKGLQTY